MAQTIKLKRSSTEGQAPSTEDLELGEVAINTYDGKMYIKKDTGTAQTPVESIVEINLQPSYNHHTQLFAGYTNLGTSPSKIGNDFYLRNYSSNYYKRFTEVSATLNYVGITSTNDFNLRVILVVPSSSGNAVDIGSIESITSTSTYNRDIVMSGDLTHWFSDYVGIGANSDGTSPFPVIVSAVYNPTTDKTTFNVGIYGATIPSVGDSLYVHPFDWESTGSELIGHTKQFDVYSEAAMSYQTYTKVYFGNIDRTASCRIKMYETHSSDSVAVTKLEVFQLDQKG